MSNDYDYVEALLQANETLGRSKGYMLFTVEEVGGTTGIRTTVGLHCGPTVSEMCPLYSEVEKMLNELARCLVVRSAKSAMETGDMSDPISVATTIGCKKYEKIVSEIDKES